jgi:hypothetical protein
MNIFPIRKSGSTTLKKKFNKDFKENKIQNNEIVHFPSESVYHTINENLLKKYLKMDVKHNIEKNVVNTIDTNIKLDIKSQDNYNNLVEISENIYKLNKSITIDNKIHELFIFKLEKQKEIREHIDYIHQQNFNLIFETFNKKDIETIYTAKKLVDVELNNIIKSIFINLLKTKMVPNFCNLWIFGQENSIFIEGTYIPISQGSYSDDDYLDLMIDVVINPYLKLDKKDIYTNISLNKQNEGLYFLLFK